MLKIYADAKGIKFVMHDIMKVQKIKPDTQFLNARIINADNIQFSGTEYGQLYLSRKKNTATDIEKLQLKKADIKFLLGVDVLDDAILDAYKGNYDMTRGFLHLLDPTNIIEHSDGKHVLIKEKARICKSLITDTGFSNIFDTTVIDADTFEQNIDTLIKTNDVYQKSSDVQMLFGMCKSKPNIISKKAILGNINAILSSAQISIKSSRKTIAKQHKSFYTLTRLHSVCEIIKYKKDNGFQFNDCEKLFSCNEPLVWAYLKKTYTVVNVPAVKYDDIVDAAFIIDFMDE